jgi:hypothetical protein
MTTMIDSTTEDQILEEIAILKNDYSTLTNERRAVRRMIEEAEYKYVQFMVSQKKCKH